MRPPRYRFPDEVRTATRLMATRMVRDESIARSPEELESWIEAHPDSRQPLEKGGYGTEFDAHELFPLLDSILRTAGAPAPETAEPEGSRKWIWVAAVVLVVVVAGILAVALGSA